MGMITLKIEGAKELERALVALPASASKNVMRSALMAAAKPVEKRAREKAKGHGFSAGRSKAIKRKFVSPRRKTNFTARVDVGFQIGTKQGGFVLNIWERGFRHVGGKLMPPRPTVRPALAETKGQSVIIFSAKMRSSIQKHAKRLAMKTARFR
jgi:HK97 gp10 family phage protein